MPEVTSGRYQEMAHMPQRTIDTLIDRCISRSATNYGNIRLKTRNALFSLDSHGPVPIYSYQLPQEEVLVEAIAVLLAYLTVFKYASFEVQDEGALNELAYAFCQQLRHANPTRLTNDYPLFCRLFMAYFVAAYETIIQQCEEDGGKIVQELAVLLDHPFPEKCVDLLRLLIFHLVHLHHAQEVVSSIDESWA
jgi:hypothetical protein